MGLAKIDFDNNLRSTLNQGCRNRYSRCGHFSALKKKKKKNEKKGEKQKKSGEKKSVYSLFIHNPFYNNPILTYCTNYGLNFLKALASRGLRPLTPTRGSAPWIPAGGHTPRPPSRPYHF